MESHDKIPNDGAELKIATVELISEDEPGTTDTSKKKKRKKNGKNKDGHPLLGDVGEKSLGRHQFRPIHSLGYLAYFEFC